MQKPSSIIFLNACKLQNHIFCFDQLWITRFFIPNSFAVKPSFPEFWDIFGVDHAEGF